MWILYTRPSCYTLSKVFDISKENKDPDIVVLSELYVRWISFGFICQTSISESLKDDFLQSLENGSRRDLGSVREFSCFGIRNMLGPREMASAKRCI